MRSSYPAPFVSFRFRFEAAQAQRVNVWVTVADSQEVGPANISVGDATDVLHLLERAISLLACGEQPSGAESARQVASLTEPPRALSPDFDPPTRPVLRVIRGSGGLSRPPRPGRRGV